MKKETTTKSKKLAFWSELYTTAKNDYAEKCAEFDTHMQQYLGSDAIDGSNERASTVRNITYEMIESQVSSDIPPPKVDPACYSERKNRNAKSIERLLSSIRDRLSYEEMNDIDERYTYIFGSSIWYAEWDNSSSLGKEVGSVKLHCLSPKSFIPQPGIAEIDDMEYCFLEFTASAGEIMRKYSVSEEDISLADFDYRSEDSISDSVRITVAFYRGENGEIGQFYENSMIFTSSKEKFAKSAKMRNPYANVQKRILKKLTLTLKK